MTSTSPIIQACNYIVYIRCYVYLHPTYCTFFKLCSLSLSVCLSVCLSLCLCLQTHTHTHHRLIHTHKQKTKAAVLNNYACGYPNKLECLCTQQYSWDSTGQILLEMGPVTHMQECCTCLIDDGVGIKALPEPKPFKWDVHSLVFASLAIARSPLANTTEWARAM